MPLQIDSNLPTAFPEPKYLTLDSFKKGVISLLDKSKLPKDALEVADNLFLVEDGQPKPRPGVDWFGAEAPNTAEIDGFDYFDYAGAIHLVIVAGGNIYRSTDNGDTWTLCTGATLTAGTPVNMNQNRGFLYLTNGVDNMVRYNGTTTIQTYTSLVTPPAPTPTKTGLSGSTYTYYYKVSAVNEVGTSAASPKGTTTVGITRDGWDATSNYVTWTWTAVSGATRYDIFISEDDLDYYYIDSTFTNTYKDSGIAPVISATTAPSENTTTGPKVEELVNIGGRQYGVRDPDNPYRIWFTGGDANSGSFSRAYNGGYYNWQTGGKFRPVQVVDYRDGKGDPYATVWCSSADGQGSILQLTLEELTIQDITVVIPSAYQLPGSRGTPAPGSVVNVLNDYMFYNSQAFYNLGSRAQYLNLLSTDEASANIRPTVKQISTAGEENIASVYFDAKVYFSVGYGSSSNNAVCIFDTEQKAWLPRAFTIGFKKFVKYTDTNGARRLLCVKPGDTRLSEIGSNILGDYGVPFSTELKTGLYPTTKNRFEFQWTEEGEIELSNPVDQINIELLGIERRKGFTSNNSTTITNTFTNTGWDTYAWDTRLWDDTSDAVDTYSESSVKRYFRVARELNAIQWRITTSTLDADYTLRTLQTWGTESRGGKPRSWRLSS